MTWKPRVRLMADGRIGFPGVVAYEITEGPNRGRRLLTTPRWPEYAHEDPTLLEKERKAYRQATVAYKLVVLDPAQYARLVSHGWMRSFYHIGWPKPRIDNQPTAGE